MLGNVSGCRDFCGETLMKRLVLWFVAFGTFSTAARAGDDATIPGEITIPAPTIINLAVEWKISGDANLNGIVAVRYRAAGEQDWHEAQPLRRVPAGESRGTSPVFRWENRHSGSIFDLLPDTVGRENRARPDATGAAPGPVGNCAPRHSGRHKLRPAGRDPGTCARPVR
jgi:hypothetical protein